MKFNFYLLIFPFLFISCSRQQEQVVPVVEIQEEPAKVTFPLAEKKSGRTTKLVKDETVDYELDVPPVSTSMAIVEYPTELGNMKAYLHVKSTAKSPAIIWLTGGPTPGGGGSYLWEKTRRSNDQTAQQYRDKGMVVMYPVLRGSGGNPGKQEGFYGEVNDVISAYKYLSKHEFVDPERIYIGGHSTGGTLALLVVASCDYFQGAVVFGPVARANDYGKEINFHDLSNKEESDLRSPVLYLNHIQTETHIFEGDNGNVGAMIDFERVSKNPKVELWSIGDSDHFDILAPINEYLASLLIQAQGINLVHEASLNKALQEPSFPGFGF